MTDEWKKRKQENCFHPRNQWRWNSSLVWCDECDKNIGQFKHLMRVDQYDDAMEENRKNTGHRHIMNEGCCKCGSCGCCDMCCPCDIPLDMR